MNLFTRRLPVALAASLMVLAGAAAAEAQAVTQADIDRLEVLANDVQVDVDAAIDRNPSLNTTEFDLLREEVIYLKVKERKNERITRREYNDVADRLRSLQARARGVASGISGGTAGSGSGTYRDRDANRTYGDRVIPAGTELDVRLEQALSSETATVEQRFEATTAADIYQDDRVLIPAGSRVRGVVSSVDPASRTDRRGEMTLAFDQITVNGRNYPMRGTLLQVLEADKDNEVAKIGGGAGVGAIIGGIIGGVKGAILGAVIGAGGTIAATEGSDVKLEPGAILRLRLDEPLVVR